MYTLVNQVKSNCHKKMIWWPNPPPKIIFKEKYTGQSRLTAEKNPQASMV